MTPCWPTSRLRRRGSRLPARTWSGAAGSTDGTQPAIGATSLWRYDESLYDRPEMLKRERVILRVEGLHVPLVDEAKGQGEPRPVKGMARGCLACRDRGPVAGWERAAVPNDGDCEGAVGGDGNF